MEQRSLRVVETDKTFFSKLNIIQIRQMLLIINPIPITLIIDLILSAIHPNKGLNIVAKIYVRKILNFKIPSSGI